MQLSKLVPFCTPVVLLCTIISIRGHLYEVESPLFSGVVSGVMLFIAVIHFLVLFEKGFQKEQRSMVVFSMVTLVIPLLFACLSTFWFKGALVGNSLKNTQAILTTGLLLYLLIRMMRTMQRLYKHINNPVFVFATSFLLLALVGTALLLLPEATARGSISFVDAFFTATSAVCVTGLTVLDTAKDFTFFGKLVILILIELGGLGILTITSFFGYFFREAASFKEGLHVSNFLNSDSLSNILGLAVKIVAFTLIIEATGALLIYFSIMRTDTLTIEDPLFFSIFHAISAFCNAGFSTLSQGFYSREVRFDYFLQNTVAVLLILGGIGFNILLNFYNYLRFKVKRIFHRMFLGQLIRNPSHIVALNTRIVLTTTALLLLMGTVFYYVQEYNNTLSEHSALGKWSVAFFSSATPRTAGFQIANMTLLKPATVFFLMFLMWVGASPASCGGGIKTSAFALALIHTFSLIKGKNRTELFKKEIPYNSIKRAFAIIMLSLLFTASAIVIILSFDSQEDTLAVCFEVFSAFSTAGLSLGITPFLSTASKYILIVLMFVGRIGAFNLLVGLFERMRAPQHYRYPKENILIN